MDKYIRAIAGSLIIVSVMFAYFVSINFIWFTLFVGVNLLQSSITKWCLMEDILRAFGIVNDKK